MTNSIGIPGYKIKKELGAGGMARVYLAVEAKLERLVALKVLSPSLSENTRITKRFIKEAKTAAQLQHSNIVSIFDVGKHEGVYYISMEFLRENLKDRMKRTPCIKPREALAIIKDVAKALSYAHEKGYIHRDIKPDNIMFRKDGAVVLVDFGIVKAVDETSKITRTGVTVGTPQYMSPEQFKAKRLDGRSDIYSLGIVLYELLVGEAPYHTKDVVKLAMKHARDPVPQLPGRLKDYQPLIDKMLAKSPHERVKSSEGLIRLIDALDYKVKAKTVSTRKIQPAARKKMPPVLVLFAVIVLMAVSVFLILQSKRTDEAADRERAQGINTVDKINQDREYEELMKQAKTLSQRGEYTNALKKLAEAKRIKVTPELISLEQEIKRAAKD
jgi:serine/threonine-protein kinase PpkA